MTHPERPLSPHLQVYRWQLTMVMSILHRATGVALVSRVCACVVAAGRRGGGESYAQAAAALASPFGKFILFGFSLALVYHLLNGLRHLMWDMGWGMEIPEVYRTGYAVAILTVLFTAAIWSVALWGVA